MNQQPTASVARRGISSVGRALRSHRRGQGSNPLFSIDHFSNRGVLNTGLGTLVTLSVLARPDALVTFTILILAIGWGALVSLSGLQGPPMG